MLVRLHKNLRRDEREAVLAACRALGMHARFVLERVDLIELEGPMRPELRSALADLAGVQSVLDPEQARELAERAPGAPDTRVRVRDAQFGGGAVSLIAGPCAVEDRARLFEIAERVRRAGATALRGGAYKPRTSPYSFQGLGPRALEWLAEVRVETGMAIVTEVLDPRDVDAVAEVCDMFQVGSRNMSNVALLRELADRQKPVLLKRGMAATAREFLLAAEYLLAGGNADVVLCERGIRGFDSATRNVLDLGTVAWLKRVTHLPVIVDPSHAAGRRELVLPLARAALAVGADGLIVEVHPAPSEVHSDGEQALAPADFEQLVREARAQVALDGRRLLTCDPVESA